MKPIHQILIQPLLTEKSVATQALKGSTRKKYTFEVAIHASKVEIAQAVETLYAKEKVKVASVNTLHVRGKERRSLGGRKRGGTQKGTSPAWKKAIVTLTAESPNITMLEGV